MSNPTMGSLGDHCQLSAVAPSPQPSSPRAEKAECRATHEMGIGAGDGSRTRDIQLGRPRSLCGVAPLVEGRAFRVQLSCRRFNPSVRRAFSEARNDTTPGGTQPGCRPSTIATIRPSEQPDWIETRRRRSRRRPPGASGPAETPRQTRPSPERPPASARSSPL